MNHYKGARPTNSVRLHGRADDAVLPLRRRNPRQHLVQRGVVQGDE